MGEADLSGGHEAASDVVSRLSRIRQRIARAAIDSGRSPSAVKLVCVSKNHGAAEIRPALLSGERIFGENRVQEAQSKWPLLRQDFPDIELHLIGPLQTNKVKDAVALFDAIETLDRPKLAEALAREFDASGRRTRLFVQVNTGREPQKAGVAPEDIDAFLEFCRSSWKLEVDGLMCIPPIGQQVSPHFALLSLIAKRNGLAQLSMGMSADYELGIQLGATHVRVGSAIFGERVTP